MSLVFHILDEIEAYQCARQINEIAKEFGFSRFDAGMFSIAVTEIVINSIRYAKDVKVSCRYTQNNKGLEVYIEDKGKGIKNIQHSLQDGNSSAKDSLGFGLGAAKRSVDEFLIEKSDTSGTSIILRKYIDEPTYEYSPVSVKKEASQFNSDAYFIKHYDGDKSLFAIIEGKGDDLSAYKTVQSVKGLLLEEYRLPLKDIVRYINLMLSNNDAFEDITLVLLRLLPDKLEYLILGNGFILSYPEMKFQAYTQASCLKLPEDLSVQQELLPEQFCIVLASDGIEYNDFLNKEVCNLSTLELATDIFNKYNLDDASTIIAVKREENNVRN
ncbi:ATP-binding protein [Sulfurimonas hydrogeniphila]|uniref:ATP-binding protein n=1 Tax=Sulfurimonas TaxID=202746 RepID=UPI00125F87C5|nr:ATP-binding protein [Sulfurimonas hydrogeniphila]